MVIEKLYIQNFGKLKEKEISLSPRVNVLYGVNEAGKTTVQTFIQSLFFGMTRMRGKASKNDAFSRYQPWDLNGMYGGKMWFLCDGKRFRLARNFQKGMESQELVCENDGEILDLTKGDLQALLGNISEAVYENVVSMTQLTGTADKNFRQELQNYMTDYEGSSDAATDLNRTIQALKMWRKGYQDQLHRRENEQRTELEKMQMSMEYLQGDLERDREKKTSALTYASDKGIQIQTEKEEYIEAFENKIINLKAKRNKYKIAEFLVFAVCGVGSAFVGFPWMLFLVGGGIGIEYFLYQYEKNIGLQIEKYEKSRIRYIKKQEKILGTIEQLDANIEEKERALDNLTKDYEEYETMMSLPMAEQTEIESLNLAMKTIQDISSSMQNRMGSGLRERTSEIFAEITNGKYTQVYMDNNLEICVNTGQKSIPLEALSRGTMEQIYFSFRMAVNEFICEEKMPVILDEIFVMYDKERMKEALRWLAKSGRQVILCTCQEREMQLLEELGIVYNKIELGETGYGRIVESGINDSI